MLTLSQPPTVEPLTDSDITWDLPSGSPWGNPDATVTAALQALPLIDDELASTVITALLKLVVQLGDQGTAYRQLIAVGLAEWHHRSVVEHRRRKLRDHQRDRSRR